VSHKKKKLTRPIEVGRVWLPPGKPTCKQCYGLIAFRQLASGKWCPCELDGKDHWDICSERQIKLGIRKRGPLTENCGTTIGRDYVPSDSTDVPF
jgi:hypothetical protein